jgi:uncharacterized protein YdgA (DUF945 family)
MGTGSNLKIPYIIMKKLKQWCLIIPPISTKQTITSHHNSLNIKKKDHNIILEKLHNTARYIVIDVESLPSDELGVHKH